MHMWKVSFHEAKKSVMVDILKAKFRRPMAENGRNS